MNSRTACSTALALSLLLAAACGEDDAKTNDDIDGGGQTDIDAGDTIDGGAPEAPDAGDEGDWSELLTGTWSLAEGKEGYWCVTLTMPRDMYVGAIKPIGPLGTHHTVVSIGAPQNPDNPGFTCGAGTNKLQWFYASGLNTEELTLPEGVGLFLAKGQQINLNLHIYNAGVGTLTGTSKILVKELEAAEVVKKAEIFLPGPLDFNIPGVAQPEQAEPHVDSGDCTIQKAQTLFAIFPHMHKRGMHFKTEILRAGQEPKVIWNADYDFDQQPFVLLPEAEELVPGDKVRTTCTWLNTTPESVQWGDSSDAEMCFAILMRYPQVGGFVPTCQD